MNDLTRYRRMPGFHKVGTGEALPPGSYSSAVADWVPDTTLHAIADAWKLGDHYAERASAQEAIRTYNPELADLLDALGDNDA